MPAEAGIQYSATAESHTSGAAHWIIRWSLSSGGAPAPTRWRLMTSRMVATPVR